MNFQTNLLTPYLTIWTKPRSTIRQILDFNPEKHVLLLAMLSGIYRFIDRASGQSLGDNMSLTSLLLLCVIGGGIVGIISLYIGGEFFRWVGSWLGGKATAQDVRAAIAWSSVPDLILLAIYIPIIMIFGRNWFISSTEWMSPVFAFVVFATIATIGFILFIWRFVLFVKCLAEAHQFSGWKGLGTSILGTLLIVVPLFVILIATR